MIRRGFWLSEVEFDTILLVAVDEALSMLSDSVKKSIYFHLEQNFHIRRDDIPRRLEAFTQAIEGIFGVGADWIEILIMKKLHEKVGGVYKWNNAAERFALTEYVAGAKRFLKESSRTCDFGVGVPMNKRRCKPQEYDNL